VKRREEGGCKKKEGAVHGGKEREGGGKGVKAGGVVCGGRKEGRQKKAGDRGGNLFDANRRPCAVSELVV